MLQRLQQLHELRATSDTELLQAQSELDEAKLRGQATSAVLRSLSLTQADSTSCFRTQRRDRQRRRHVGVNIIAQNPGQPAEEMERQVSIPIERAVNGMPGLAHVRAINLFGLSFLTLTFRDGVDAIVLARR